MRRWILTVASGLALAGALALGPLGTAAAAPYVDGCTPVTFFDTDPNTGYYYSLSIYNGSASTASLTMKILAGDGTNITSNQLGMSSYFMPNTASLPPTRTAVYQFAYYGGIPSTTNPQVPATIRIVSNVPVSATVTHRYPTASDQIPVVCKSLLP